MKGHISVIEEAFGEKLERIMSELEKMTLIVKQSSKKHLSDQRAFIEALIEWVAVKSIPFRSVNHPLFREIVRCANPDFSVPAHTTLRPHIERLADPYRQLPAHQEKCYCSLAVDGPACERPEQFAWSAYDGPACSLGTLGRNQIDQEVPHIKVL
jgi:hypothetical protein